MIARYLLLGTALVFAQDQAGRTFDKGEGRWAKALAPEMVRFAAPELTAKFLDYGANTGSMGLRLGAKYSTADVVGIEPNEDFVRWANLQSARAKVKFQAGDLMKLPFRNGEFDAAFTIGAMSRVADPYQAIAELARVTKPEGVVAAAAWESIEPMQLFWNAASAIDPEFKEPARPKAVVLKDLWIGGGFRDVVDRTVEVQVPYRDFEDYWSSFAADPWLAAQPEAKKATIRARLRQRVLGSNADGAFTLKARASMVKGIVRFQ